MNTLASLSTSSCSAEVLRRCWRCHASPKDWCAETGQCADLHHAGLLELWCQTCQSVHKPGSCKPKLGSCKPRLGSCKPKIKSCKPRLGSCKLKGYASQLHLCSAMSQAALQMHLQSLTDSWLPLTQVLIPQPLVLCFQVTPPPSLHWLRPEGSSA